MISLVTNETCFVTKSVHIRQCIVHESCFKPWLFWAMIEKTSIQPAAGSLNHYQTKHIQKGGWMQREGECPPPPLQKKHLSYYGAKCLHEVWANEEIQPQLSTMSRKQNIWENIATKLMANVSTMNSINYTTMHETCLKTVIWCELCKNMFNTQVTNGRKVGAQEVLRLQPRITTPRH